MSKENDWFFGFLSLADFTMYELINNLYFLFPDLLTGLPKLKSLRDRFGNLPAVMRYEMSSYSIKIFNPVCFFEIVQEIKSNINLKGP